MGSENVGGTEFPGFSTQIALGDKSGDEEIQVMGDSTNMRKRIIKWMTNENLVLLSGWIKYGTDSVVGRNQKAGKYWGKIADYCNEHSTYDSPRDLVACRNHFNYINKTLGKWTCSYDHVKRRRNTGSGSSGSKRAYESDVGESNNVESLPRPVGIYILSRFRERQRQALEDNEPRGKKKYLRDHTTANQRLIDDYFSNEPLYDGDMFRRRFRMQRHVFLRIVRDLSNHDNYFTHRVDATNKKGISPLAKCTTAIRMLAYGVSADAVDEYIKIGGSTALECLRRFCRGFIQLYEQMYLRAPTQEYFQRILEEWKNCPKAWEGQFTRGDKGTTTIILEAVATHDLWIWHAFFGCPGTLNDINVLDRSPLFDDVEKGNTPKVNFIVNQRPYDMAYYLVDGIYPSYPTFVKSIRIPQSDPDKLFAQKQESCRKDIERVFGVLQARFKIIREPARIWGLDDLTIMMRSCIILHNMIVEDERDTYAQHWNHYDEDDSSVSSTQQPFSTEVLPAFANYVRARSEMRDGRLHRELQEDLVKHIWAKFVMDRD